MSESALRLGGEVVRDGRGCNDAFEWCVLLLELIEQDRNAALILDLNAALTLGLNAEFQHVDWIGFGRRTWHQHPREAM